MGNDVVKRCKRQQYTAMRKKNTFLPFFLILAVIASILFLYLKRTVDQERKQDKIEKEITTGEKRMVSGTSTKSTKI